jgi:hypothetical protein
MLNKFFVVLSSAFLLCSVMTQAAQQPAKKSMEATVSCPTGDCVVHQWIEQRKNGELSKMVELEYTGGTHSGFVLTTSAGRPSPIFSKDGMRLYLPAHSSIEFYRRKDTKEPFSLKNMIACKTPPVSVELINDQLIVELSKDGDLIVK